jgi:hypothetical protein
MKTLDQVIEEELRELVQIIDMTSTKLIGPGDGPEMEKLAVEIMIWRMKSDSLTRFLCIVNGTTELDNLDQLVRDVAKKIGFAYE